MSTFNFTGLKSKRGANCERHITPKSAGLAIYANPMYILNVPITLERIPHNKQVEVHGLLSQGFPYRKIAKLVDISQGCIAAIAKHQPTNLEHVEAFKKALVGRAYAIGSRAFDFMTDSKLDACSAPQLMMVAGIAIDKARDLEGLNRPVINVIDIALNIQKLTEQAKARLSTINTAIEASNQPSDLT